MHENTTDVDSVDMVRAQVLRCKVLMDLFVDSQFLHGEKVVESGILQGD